MEKMKDVLKDVNNKIKAKEEKSIVEESLKKVLKDANTANKSRIPAEIVAEMEKANKDLEAFNFKENTLQIGDLFPDSTVLNYKSEEVSLKDLIGGKPAIISFYRGSWCPYCNLELAYYNELLSYEENKDINLFAISPEKPDVTLANKDIEKLNFDVLSDVNNMLAKKLNLVFGLPEKIQAIYEKFGINLDASQGNTEKELPVPATFIINSKGEVVYVDLDVDYTTRPEATEIIEIYKKTI